MLKDVPRRIAAGFAALAVLISCSDSPTATLGPAGGEGATRLDPAMSHEVVESEVEITVDENGNEEGLETLPTQPGDPFDPTTFPPVFDMRELPEVAEEEIGFSTDVKVFSLDGTTPTYRLVYYPAYVAGKRRYRVWVSTGSAQRQGTDWVVPVHAVGSTAPIGTTRIVLYVTNSNGQGKIEKMVEMLPKRPRWPKNVDFLPASLMAGVKRVVALHLDKPVHSAWPDYTLPFKATWGDGRITTEDWRIEEDKLGVFREIPIQWEEPGTYTVEFEVSSTEPPYKSVHKETITITPDPDLIYISNYLFALRPRAGQAYTLSFNPRGAAAEGLLDVQTTIGDTSIFSQVEPGQPASISITWPEQPGRTTLTTIVSGTINGQLMADTATRTVHGRAHPIIEDAQVPDTAFIGEDTRVSFRVTDHNTELKFRKWFVAWVPKGAPHGIWGDTPVEQRFEATNADASATFTFAEPGEYEIWLEAHTIFESDGGMVTRQMHPITVVMRPCEPGSFASGLTCEPCPAGTFQPAAGATNCIPAPTGSFVSGIGATAAELCAPGTFNNESGATTCKHAPAGSYVSDPGAFAPRKCSVGTYQDSPGQTSCIPAPPGSFVSVIGAKSATPCPAGTFQAEAGATSCDPAPAGSYVSDAGASAATPCAVGTYQPATGQTSCAPAPVGSYVDVIGATEATPCPALTSTMDAGSTSASACLFVGTVAENRMDDAIQSGELAPAQPGKNGLKQFDSWVDGVKRSVKFLQGPQHQAGCVGIRNAVRDLEGGGNPKPKVKGPASKKTADDLEWVRERNSCR